MKAIDEKQWYVVLVRSGFAPIVAAELDTLGIPVLSADSSVSPPAEIGKIPTSTIFAQFALDRRRSVLILPGVLCIAGIPDPVAMIDRDIDALRAAICARLPMKVMETVENLHQGRMMNGPLSGRTAQFLESDGKWHLAVPVPPLDQTFAFAVPLSSVDMLHGTHSR